MLLSKALYCSDTNLWRKENRPILMLAVRNYTCSSPCDNLYNRYVDAWLFVTNAIFKNYLCFRRWEKWNFQKFQKLFSSSKFRSGYFQMVNFIQNNFFSNTIFHKLQMLILLRCKYSHSMKYRAIYHYNTKTNKAYGPWVFCILRNYKTK